MIPQFADEHAVQLTSQRIDDVLQQIMRQRTRRAEMLDATVDAIGFEVPDHDGQLTVALDFLEKDELVADVADDDFLKTGTRKQGMFISIYHFFNTLSSSIVIALYTVGLEFFNYDGTLESQSDFTTFGIRFLATIIPIIAVILCFLIIQFFPLKGERYQELRTKMEELHSEEDTEPTLV